MKKQLFAVVIGCLGLCAGFILCHFHLQLPQRETTTAAQPTQNTAEGEQTLITSAADGSLHLAGEEIDLNQLGSRLKELGDPHRPIAIRADKDVPFKRIVEVMDATKEPNRDGSEKPRPFHLTGSWDDRAVESRSTGADEG